MLWRLVFSRSVVQQFLQCAFVYAVLLYIVPSSCMPTSSTCAQHTCSSVACFFCVSWCMPCLIIGGGCPSCWCRCSCTCAGCLDPPHSWHDSIVGCAALKQHACTTRPRLASYQSTSAAEARCVDASLASSHGLPQRSAGIHSQQVIIRRTRLQRSLFPNKQACGFHGSIAAGCVSGTAC